MNANNYLFVVGSFRKANNSVVLGHKHPLVTVTNVLFSSMSNRSFYTQTSKPVDPVVIDPNKYGNLEKLLKQYGFSGNPNLEKLINVKNRAYIELIFQDASTGIWYVYASRFMTIQNTDSANLIVELPSYVSGFINNDQRFEYYDQGYFITENVPTTENFPSSKQFSYKNNPSLYSTLGLTATLNSFNSSPYTERAVNRTSCFVFTPGTTCYLLINYNPAQNIKKIYCLQTWCNSVYTELDPTTNMCLLNTYLQESPNVSQPLPEYWTFTQCILDDTSMIALFSNPSMGITARVISDGVSNSYQYVRPEEAPFLYEQF